MATARTAVNVWSTTFEKLQKVSKATEKPMTELLDEGVHLLIERYMPMAAHPRERL